VPASVSIVVIEL